MTVPTPHRDLYVVWASAPERAAPWPGEVFELTPGLCLVRTALSQSRLYHRIKRTLPEGSALLVGTLKTGPKHKGLAPGALPFVRSGGAAEPDDRHEQLGLV
ncbi:MAG: hypothetical protein ACK4I0_01170 [Brevundimonas sp.]|uniref:hypothetical protein n=1 Tax=Brevundimonas sp. TaxID=1871086 RepID=UPI003919E99A